MGKYDMAGQAIIMICFACNPQDCSLWSRKKIDDWNEQNVSIDRCNDCDVGRIQNILEKVPEEFYGKGYYS